MRRVLSLHPDSSCDAVSRIEVEIERPWPDALMLNYLVAGRITDLYLPPALEPVRADELWKRTCFEAFLRPSPGEAYFEFNFSPSTHWATYRFDSYRSGMASPQAARTTHIGTRRSGDRFELDVGVNLSGLAGDTPWSLGVSAVIEETNGRKSYWALTHPPGKADFHHADGFAVEL
jgi:hypothetical protein